MVDLTSIYVKNGRIYIEGYFDGNEKNSFLLVLDEQTCDIIECNAVNDYGYMRKVRRFIERTLEEGKSLPRSYSLAWF